MQKIILAVLFAVSSASLQAQLVVKLSGETLNSFEAYAAKVEAGLESRWRGGNRFLQVEDEPADLALCLSGKLAIQQLGNGSPVEVPHGLIHDWVGTVFIPGVDVQAVLTILENFDDHHNIYPEVTASRTLQRNGHEVVGSWRLQQKGMVPVILDVEQRVLYEQIAPGKWKGHAYARRIVETDTTPFARGRKFPPDEGHGYLWRLYSYWTLETRSGGVLAECRTLSLSRDIPSGLAWAVGPYVQKMPETSIRSTLEHTREAATK